MLLKKCHNNYVHCRLYMYCTCTVHVCNNVNIHVQYASKKPHRTVLIEASVSKIA